MDNGIFGLAMYGALKRDATVNYIETKKGKVTLAELVAFYEEHVEEHTDERKPAKKTELQEQREVESVPKTKNVKTRKHRPHNEKETM